MGMLLVRHNWGSENITKTEDLEQTEPSVATPGYEEIAEAKVVEKTSKTKRTKK